MSSRKKIIVNKNFQLSFIMMYSIMTLIASLIVFVCLVIWSKNTYSQGFAMRVPNESEVTAWAKANNLKTEDVFTVLLDLPKSYSFFELTWKPVLIIIVFNILILIVFTAIYSNKIAGPLFRLKRELEQKVDGSDINPIIFRKGDAFHEVAELINQCLKLKR
ncbi:MAG TPA: hypothetical protein DC049_06210 [Spirochaetia bacterium]|nr:hypothetical protein [Spirochaetia bacterium]